MKTRDEVLALMHRRTRGACTDVSLSGLRICLSDLLAILEFCEVVGERAPSTMAEAREAAIKAGDIALGKRVP